MMTCLVWDWLLEKDHLVRILKMLLTLHCHVTTRWIMWIFMVTRQRQCIIVSSVQL